MSIACKTVAVICLLMVKSIARETDQAHPYAIITATSSGALAMDEDSFGGNPFATALIKALKKDSKSSTDLFNLLTAVTKDQSRGYQSPDLLRNSNRPVVPFSMEYETASRLALVMVYSDYSGSGMQSLPGAEFDLKRIRNALSGNGFDCWGLLDPTETQLEATLKAFGTMSKSYEFSTIYVTGHGVEVGGNIYLLPSNYRISEGRESLETKALNITSFLNYLRSNRGNFLFYGGCRNDPF